MTPVRAPGVTNNPVVLAFGSPSLVRFVWAIISRAISHEENTMVDLVIWLTALEIFFSQDSISVVHKSSSWINGNRDWLLLQELTKLLVIATIVLHIPDVLDVVLLFEFLILHSADVMRVRPPGVILLLQDAVLTHVSEALVHPSSATGIVVSVAVNELLDRILSELLVVAWDESQTLNCCCGTERPAATTPLLVVGLCYFAFFVPVLVIWDVKTSSSNFFILFRFKNIPDFLTNIINDVKSSFLFRNFDALEFEIFHLVSSLLWHDESSVFSNKSLLWHIRVLVDGKFNTFIILRRIMLRDEFVIFSKHLEPLLELRFRQVGFAVLRNKLQVSLEGVQGVSWVQRNRIWLGVEADS
mgnify:CR=1 FL=1